MTTLTRRNDRSILGRCVPTGYLTNAHALLAVAKDSIGE